MQGNYGLGGGRLGRSYGGGTVRAMCLLLYKDPGDEVENPGFSWEERGRRNLSKFLVKC